MLLALGSVTFAMSRPDIADPGPPVLLDASPAGISATPEAAPKAKHADDGDDAGDDDVKADRDYSDDDDFEVAAPRPVEADGDDWDDDGDDRDDDNNDRDDLDDDNNDGDDRDDHSDDSD